MLEGHVLRELLQPSAQSTEAFRIHELFHGITAPAFLFSAGFTFAIATQRKWEEMITLSGGFLRRIWRAILVIVVGYLLHIPFLSLTKTLAEASTGQWREFLAFNVLQCIGVSLLFLRLLVFTVRKERVFLIVASLIGLAIVYATPLVWMKEVTDALPRGIAMAINGLDGSYFPIFPYSAFLFGGAVLSWQFLRSAQVGREAVFMTRLFLGGMGLIVVGFVFDALPFQTYGQYDFWTTSPNFFWMKFGTLAMIMSSLWFLEGRVRHDEKRDIWMPRWLTILGVESFFVYVLHLIVLYGWAGNPSFNLSAWWALQLSVTESVAVFVGLTIAMWIAAAAWRYLKREHTVLWRGILWWMGITFGIHFLKSPY